MKTAIYTALLSALLSIAAVFVLFSSGAAHPAGGFFTPGLNTAGGGLCNITAYAATISATSTAQVDCGAATSSLAAISGIAKTDKVLVSMSSTSPSANFGLQVISSAPSSTPGFITIKLFNGTGAAFTWSSASSSSIPYLDSK